MLAKEFVIIYSYCSVVECPSSDPNVVGLNPGCSVFCNPHTCAGIMVNLFTTGQEAAQSDFAIKVVELDVES